MIIRFQYPVRRYPPDALPIAFGAADSPPPPKPPKRQPVAAAEFGTGWTAAGGAASCRSVQAHGRAAARDWQSASQGAAVSDCVRIRTADFARLHTAADVRFSPPAALKSCVRSLWQLWPSVSACRYGGGSNGRLLHNCAAAPSAAIRLLTGKGRLNQSATAAVGQCKPLRQQGAAVSGCLTTASSRSVQPPCEYYTVILPDPPPPVRCPCGMRPPANRLPLPFKRRNVGDSPDQIPLPFGCRTDFARIPSRDHYIMINHISASFDGQPLELLSAEITADTGGYCWQASLKLPPSEFAKLGLPAADRSRPPLIDITLNGDTWRIMAEQYSDNRSFGHKTYTVTGRSITALTGADYAPVNQGMVSGSLYARQIADRQLQHSGIRIADWQAADWLVPANVYALTDKTPMGVITEIAAAAGAFVETHPHLPQISVKPLWPVAAWRLAQAVPQVSVPVSAVLSVSGSIRVSALCKGVFVGATHSQGVMTDVRREGSNGHPRAPLHSHALYATQKPCRAAAIALLSATGTHKTETVKLPLMPKYGLHRAELGQVWRFEEAEGAWQGVITGIGIRADIENGAPVLHQTLTVDRYLDG